MKTILKVALFAPAVVVMFLADVPPETPLRVQLVPEAQAIFGIWRRHFRRWAVIGTAAVVSSEDQQAAAAKQQAATAQKEAAAAQKQAAAAPHPVAAAAPPPPAPPPAAAGKPLPLGDVVSMLPAGCTSTPVGGVDYFYCGGNFYRAVFQGNNLVYVTAQP